MLSPGRLLMHLLYLLHAPPLQQLQSQPMRSRDLKLARLTVQKGWNAIMQPARQSLLQPSSPQALTSTAGTSTCVPGQGLQTGRCTAAVWLFLQDRLFNVRWEPHRPACIHTCIQCALHCICGQDCPTDLLLSCAVPNLHDLYRCASPADDGLW